jgi:hypothetical protein
VQLPVTNLHFLGAKVFDRGESWVFIRIGGFILIDVEISQRSQVRIWIDNFLSWQNSAKKSAIESSDRLILIIR